MTKTLLALKAQEQPQLSFMSKIYAYEKEEALSLKHLNTFIKALQYLKVNTLLYSTQSASSGVELEKKVDLLLELSCTMEFILTNRQGDMAEYIKSRQDVTIYAVLPRNKHDIYVNVSRLHVPSISSELSGIISVSKQLDDILKELKNDLQD